MHFASRILLSKEAVRRLAFYDSTVEAHASKLPHRLRVGECMHRVPQMTTESVIANARYVHEQLPIRLARLIRSMQTLPFIMGVNPHLNQVYNIYWDAFQAVSTFHSIENAQDEEEFGELLDFLLTKNSNQLQILAKGLSEVRSKTGSRLSSAFFTSFVDNFLREAMLRRLLVSNYLVAREAAREHLARQTHMKNKGSTRDSIVRKEGAIPVSPTTTAQTAPYSPFDPTRGNDIFSVFDLHCSPKTIVERAVENVRNQCLRTFNLRSPKFIIDGDLHCECMTIPSHLQYIIAEILKNAAQAVMQRHPDDVTKCPPPIEITIRKGVDLGFVIADQGGGIPPDKRSLIWSYGMSNFGPASSSSSSSLRSTTSSSSGAGGTMSNPQSSSSLTYVNNDGILIPTSSTLSGDGFGLPTARVYIRHLGGDIRIESTYGYGCHCHLSFPPIKDDQFLT